MSKVGEVQVVLAGERLIKEFAEPCTKVGGIKHINQFSEPKYNFLITNSDVVSIASNSNCLNMIKW